MYWLLVSLAFLIGALFIGTVFAAVMASTRETREEEAAQFDPAGKDGAGFDIRFRER